LWLHLPRESSRPLKPRVRGSTPGFPARRRVTYRTRERTQRIRCSRRSPALLPSLRPPPTLALALAHWMSSRGHWCLFAVVGPFGTGCRLPPAMTRAECCSSSVTKRSTPRPSGLDAQSVARWPRPRRWPLLPWYGSCLMTFFSLDPTSLFSLLLLLSCFLNRGSLSVAMPSPSSSVSRPSSGERSELFRQRWDRKRQSWYRFARRRRSG
jgi:hypothetical protein